MTSTDNLRSDSKLMTTRTQLDAGELPHALSNRHILFIAIGGAIGAGFFLGSGVAIKTAGPGMLVAYTLSGLIVFLMVRALGEMTVGQPEAGSFATYAEQYVGEWAGFVTGWAYWLIWILVGAAEITAVGVMTRYWYPTVPQWIPALAAVLALYGLNLLRVRVFGELEFWLALVKVGTIVLLIIGGCVYIGSHRGVPDETAAFSNLWAHGGFFPSGIAGLLGAFPVALFAFGGTELIGLTAAEAQDPLIGVPRAINGVIVRMLLFYLGSFTVIVAVVPWGELVGGQSPFVLAVGRMGFPGAATIVSCVALTAVVSSCNSGIFASGRMLRSLALRGHAPRWIGQLTPTGHPSAAVTVSALTMLLGVALNYMVPERALEYVMDSVTMLLLWVWAMIVFSHLRYLKVANVRVRSFPLPGSPVSNWVALLFFAAVALYSLVDPRSRAAVAVAVLFLATLGATYLIHQRRDLNIRLDSR